VHDLSGDGYAVAPPAAELAPAVLRGLGHAAYFIAGNTCVDDNVTRYLVAGRTPPAGTVCQPEGSPFDAQPATKASTAAVAGVVLLAAVRQALHGN
jgi:hypothetical protein